MVNASSLVKFLFFALNMSNTHMRTDWDNREFVEMVRLNILSITKFLNEFDQTTRYKLAKIHERTATIERNLEHLEHAIRYTRKLKAKQVKDEE